MFRLLPILLLLLVFSFAIFKFTPLKTDLAYKLGISGDPTSSCCQVGDILNSDGSFNELADIATFDSQIIDYPKTSLASYQNSDTTVLGTTTAEGLEKWIEVDLTTQTLRAWEGNNQVMEFPISSGKWAPTPKGTFNIWYKTRYQSMIGGNKDWGTYYNLPNVPNNMFFYQGYGLHGAYWHNNFGHPMSHGCVNEPLANAAQIFDWAGPNVPAGQNYVRATAENPGTRVYIH